MPRPRKFSPSTARAGTPRYWTQIPAKSLARLSSPVSRKKPSSTGMAFAVGVAAFVSVIQQVSADNSPPVGNINTQVVTAPMALDPKPPRVYRETVDFTPAAAPTPDNPRPRPTPIAGSFVILEIGQ